LSLIESRRAAATVLLRQVKLLRYVDLTVTLTPALTLTKALLLREVKLLRYVDTEFLPSLAEVLVRGM